MNFDFNENPFSDSRVVTYEQADMAKIKLVCVDIFLANAPKEVKQTICLRCVNETECINCSSFLYIFIVSALFLHQVGNSIHCNVTSSRNTSTILYV
jgi:hypothetical protein